jgi:hypothetical protein
MTLQFDEGLRGELVAVAQAVVGDRLRSLTAFGPDAHEQLYIREDCEPDADVGAFADVEARAFDAPLAYGDSELGDYRFTIRGFGDGYLTRVAVEDRGVFATTDELPVERFRDLANSLREVLEAD